MGKIARYVGNLLAFGSGATGTNRTVFGAATQSDILTANINADFLAGWENGLDAVTGFPPQEYFNAIGWTATQLAAYLHQMGIAEYDALQEYHNGSLCNVAGVIYRSLVNTNIGNDPTLGAPNWAGIDAATLGGDEAALFAKLASPVFSGNPTAPTQSPGNNTTRLATTAFVESSKTGSVVKFANIEDSVVATGSTIMPTDNTIPQITEGDEYMTLSFTPTKATNKLQITVVANFGHSTVHPEINIALFKDATANALAACTGCKNGAVNNRGSASFVHTMIASGTAAVTFRVRMGAAVAGTTTFNGGGGGQIFGGVMASSITITEIEV